MLSTAFVLAASMVAGQAEATPSNAKHLKGFDWLIGTWEAKYESPADIPELGVKKGATQDTTISWKHMLKRNIVAIDWKSTTNGTTRQGHEIAAWNPAANEVAHVGYSTEGVFATGKFTQGDDSWTLDWSGTAADGSTVSGKAVLTKIDADSYTWHMVELKVGDKVISDMPKVTFQRQQKSRPAKPRKTREK